MCLNKCAAALRRGPTQCFSSHHNLDLHLWGTNKVSTMLKMKIFIPLVRPYLPPLADNPWWALLLRGKLCNTNSYDTASKYSYTFLGNHCFTIISPRNWVRIQCTSTKNSRHKLHCITIIIAPNFLRNHCIIILSPWNWYCIRIILQLVQCMRVHMSLHQNSNLLQTLHHQFICHYIRIHNPPHFLAKSASHIWEHCGIASQFVQFLHGDCIR